MNIQLIFNNVNINDNNVLHFCEFMKNYLNRKIILYNKYNTVKISYSKDDDFYFNDIYYFEKKKNIYWIYMKNFNVINDFSKKMGEYYTNFIKENELEAIEKIILKLMNKKYKNNTKKIEINGSNNKILRIKLFFGYRYLWKYTNKVTLFKDVNTIESLKNSILLKLLFKIFQRININFDEICDSLTINIYFKEGLSSHFDKIQQWQRPIFLIRLFSDSRLSFGMGIWNKINGKCAIDFERGSIFKFCKNTYGVDKIKHSLRDIDIFNITAVIAIRKIQPSCEII